MTFDKNKLLAPQTAISIRGLKHSEFASHETHCFQSSIWLNTDFLTNFMDVGENEDFKPHMILGDVRVCIAFNDGQEAQPTSPNSNHQERNVVRVHAPPSA